MYFFSVISPLSEAQLSADPHTMRYNTDDFQLTPTTGEATYPPECNHTKGHIFAAFFRAKAPINLQS